MRRDVGGVPIVVDTDLANELVVLQFEHGYLATSANGARRLARALGAAAHEVDEHRKQQRVSPNGAGS